VGKRMSDSYLKKAKKSKLLKGYCCYWDNGPFKKWAKRNRKYKQSRRILKALASKEIKENT
jgi:hypothetical protein